MRPSVILSVAFAFLFGADTPSDEAAKKDLEKLQGDWVMESSERDGKKLTDAQVKGYSRNINGKSYTVTIENEEGFHELAGTITLDPTQKPKTIDAQMTNGSMKGQTMFGIYKLEGDAQTVCFAPPGQKRPTDFDSKQGTLTVWKRDKKRSDSSGERKRDDSALRVASDKPVKPVSRDSLHQIVDDGNRQAIEAFKKGDMLAVARGYADDATIYFPRGKKVHGREAIDRYWQSIQGAKDWKLETIEVGGTKEAIYEVGKSTLTTEVNGKASTYVCDYVVIWKPQKDGSYRAHTDIFN
jgi:uncharacterized protein (TIGR03067 family)